MPKIQLEIPLEVSEKLKKYAKDDFRSLRNYLVLKLTDLANLGYATAMPTPTSVPTPAFTSTSTSAPAYIPNPNANTTTTTVTTTKIKTTPQKSEEEILKEQINEFQKLAKQLVGHEVPIGEVYLEPDNTYYPFATQHEGKFLRWAYEMPYDKQMEYLKEWKEYEDKGILS